MAEKLVIKGPVFIEDEGRPVAVLVPIELFRAWQQQLQTQAPHSHPPQPAVLGQVRRCGGRPGS